MIHTINLLAGTEEGRPTLSSANPSRIRSTGMPFNAGSLSKQKNPVANEPNMSKEVGSILVAARTLDVLFSGAYCYYLMSQYLYLQQIIHS